MDLSELLLPQRLPRQVVFAGDRHAEIIVLRERGGISRVRVEGASLAEGGERDWAEVLAKLQPGATGVVFSASPFIYNFFEFDKLPWQRKALRELVAWRLQKIFPENIASYDHRFFRLDAKRVLSILVRRSLAEKAEQALRESGLPLIYLGNSTMEILARLQRAKIRPDFFIESDRDSCTMVFLDRRSPVYIRKFKSSSPADAVEEIARTVTFVRDQYGAAARHYCLIDHQDEASAAAMEENLAAADLARLNDGLGPAPYIPGCP